MTQGHRESRYYPVVGGALHALVVLLGLGALALAPRRSREPELAPQPG